MLPLGTVPAPAAAPEDDGAGIVDRLTEAGGRVLLAEDNEVNALVVEAMLHRNGCQVLRAADGAEAVRLATDESSRPSIVLMDCQMPEVDGLEATRRIRAAEVEHGWPRVPVTQKPRQRSSSTSRRKRPNAKRRVPMRAFTNCEPKSLSRAATPARRTTLLCKPCARSRRRGHW